MVLATAVLAAIGVVFRRRWPLAMLALTAGASALRLVFVGPPTVLDLSVLVLVYTVAARLPRVRSLAALAVLLIGTAAWNVRFTVGFHVVIGGDPRHPPEPDRWGGLLMIGSALVAAWAVGSAAHERARHVERDRAQAAALAVAAERARISREMHDVVGHGLATMVIQAQGGAATLDDQPARTGAALDAIVTVGRAALADLRQAVGVLKEGPGLAQLPTLLASVERAGTPVRLEIVGTPVDLPSTVDLSAYRIVQEALTNTMKHAGPGASAEVVLTYDAGQLRVEINDDGAARR